LRFEDFAAARLPALLRYAKLLTADDHEAEDLVQDALAKALRRWRRIAGLDEPYAYVRAILTNHFLSQRRRRRFALVPLDDEHDRPAPSGPEPGAGDDLWALLRTLPAQQRTVLVLRYYEDLGDEQIAAVLGCRPGTVRGYASRALATLRIHIELKTEVR
jgi:RNA polymerase sigma-70 factor (sigma-E family)